jgi:hypothetical protein
MSPKRSWTFAGRLALSFAGGIIATGLWPIPTLAQSYVDPRQNPAGYAAWCSGMGGTVFNNASGYGCSAPGLGGGMPADAAALAPVTNAVGQAIGEAIGHALKGQGGTAGGTPNSSPVAIGPEEADEISELERLEQAERQVRQSGSASSTTVAPPSPPEAAADQLCEAAGANAGCIQKFTPSRTGGDRPISEPANKTALAAPPPPVVRPQEAPLWSLRPNVNQHLSFPPPGRAGGYPIANSLDELRSFDYSDIRANLAAMSPQDLARLKLASKQQEAARLDGVIEGLRRKYFPLSATAATPVDAWADVAKQAVLEAAKEQVPFWRQAAATRSPKPAEAVATPASDEYEIVAGYLGQADKLREYVGLIEEFLHEPEPPPVITLEWVYGRALVESVLAADGAAKGDKMSAFRHSGEAADALIHVADFVMSEAMLSSLTKSQVSLAVGLAAVDLAAHGYDLTTARLQAGAAHDDASTRSIEIAARVDALKGKLRGMQNLERMAAELLHCG